MLRRLDVSCCAALLELVAPHNQMDALPTGVCGLGRLSTIDLSNNKLRSLPPELGESTSLTRLELSNNELSSLPPSLGMLRQLTVFHLQGNRLRSIPSALLTGPTSRLLKHLADKMPLPAAANGAPTTSVHAGAGAGAGASPTANTLVQMAESTAVEHIPAVQQPVVLTRPQG